MVESDRNLSWRLWVSDQLGRGGAGSSSWIVSGSPDTTAWFRSHLSFTGGAAACVTSWNALLTHLEEVLYLPESAPADPQASLSAMAEALEEITRAEGHVDGLRESLAADRYGVSSSLIVLIEHLWEWNWDVVIPEKLVSAVSGAAAPIVRAHLRFLYDLAVQYAARLRKRAILPTPDRGSRLLHALAESGPVPGLEALYIDEPEVLAPRPARIALELARRGIRVAAPAYVRGVPEKLRVEPPRAQPDRGGNIYHSLMTGPDVRYVPGDRSLTVIRVRDPREESEAAARLILSLLREGPGLRYAEIAVAAPESEISLVASALDGHGLPFRSTSRIDPMSEPLLQSLRSYLRLWMNGPDPVDLSVVFNTPGGGTRGALADRWIVRISKDKALTWPAVTEALAKVTKHADEVPSADLSKAEIERHVGFRKEASLLIQPLVEPVPSDPHGFTEVLNRVLSFFLSRFGRTHPPLDENEDELEVRRRKAVADAVRDAVKSLTSDWLARDLVRPDIGAFLLEVARLLNEVELTFGSRSWDSVNVVADANRLWPRPRVLVVLGFVRGQYPAKPSVRPLIGGPEREALRRLGPEWQAYPDETDLVGVEMRRTWNALSRASERLFLFVPWRTLAGEPVEEALAGVEIRSRFVDEANRKAWEASCVLRLDQTEGWPDSWKTVPGVAVGRSSAREALYFLAHSLSEGRPLDEESRGIMGALRERATPLAAAWLPDLDFALQPHLPKPLHETGFTPSSVETLLKCRYSFYVRNVLNLNEAVLARYREIDVQTKGTIVHRVLQHLEENRGLDRELTEADLDQAFLEVLRDDYPGALSRQFRLQVLDLKRLTANFLRYYQRLKAQAGLFGAKPEVGFGPLPFPLEDGKTISLSGRIDRIEQVMIGGSERRLPVDFKLGPVRKIANQRKERDLGVQAALYPWALAQEKGTLPPAGFIFISLSRRETDALAMEDAASALKAAKIRLDQEAWSLVEYQKRLTGTLTRTLSEISQPGASIQPHTVEERKVLKKLGVKSCELCPAGLLCRFSE